MRVALAFSLIAGVLASLSAVETRTVTYQDGATTLQGYAAIPALKPGTTAPGVLVVHEWWGHNDYADRRARELAEAGFVAFALDMYGVGKVTEDPKQAGAWAGPLYQDRATLLARARAGLDQLRQVPGVDGTRLGAIGFCFGGTVALELARAGEPLAAAVGLHAGLKPLGPAGSAPITARVLVCHGGSDPMVPPADVAGFFSEMVAAKVDWRFEVYGTALHAFTNPKARDLHAILPGVDYDPVAEKAAIATTVAFLSESFAKK